MLARISIFVLFALALSIPGCGGRGYTSYPVSGTVKYADGSIPQGEISNVLLVPISTGKATKAASGNIEPNGTFAVSTVEPGDGAFPGEYKVVFNIFKTYIGHESIVAEKFTNPEITPFTIKVGPGEKSHHDFVIEKAP